VKDVIGREMTPVERRILKAYDAIVALLEEPDLAPTVVANLKDAAATMWVLVNELGLPRERPDDLHL
jgi:hypothetical protein